MIRMLIVGYVFAIRSERLLCREVKVNLAYRWFCGLRTRSRITRRSRVRVMSAAPIRSLQHINRKLGSGCCIEIRRRFPRGQTFRLPFCSTMAISFIGLTAAQALRIRCASSISGTSGPAWKPTRAGTSNSLAT